MRNYVLKITYDAVDISRDIAPMLSSFSYTDNESGKADDISISLENSAGVWNAGWFPEKGATITADIICKDWFIRGDEVVLKCGMFLIDELDFGFGDIDTLDLKCTSVDTKTGLAREKITKAWENISLKEIAAEIAGNHGLGLFYDVDDEILYDRKDQQAVSDIKFLRELCKDENLNIKITNSRLIIFENKKYDAVEPVLTYQWEAPYSDGIRAFRIKSQSYDAYGSCEVTYWDPLKKLRMKYLYVPPVPPVGSGKVLKINKRAKTQAEAERYAIASLDRKNKRSAEGSISLAGDPRLEAGVNIQIEGFGRLSGKYRVVTVRHTLTTGYETTADVRLIA